MFPDRYLLSGDWKLLLVFFFFINNLIISINGMWVFVDRLW
jgi:hypothetical protein